MTMSCPDAASSAPNRGSVDYHRTYYQLVEDVRPSDEDGVDIFVSMACLDDGVNCLVQEVL